jgi:hypothetical protein
MGYNTTVIVMNDALSEIEKDPEFVKKLVAAILKVASYGKPVDVPAGGHCNPVTVIETHHADNTTLVSVGGNYATVLLQTYGWTHHEKEMQFRLSEELDAVVTKAPPK